MSFPRYESYKDSGVEWLGEVPDHWKVTPFKRHIERNDGGVWGEEPDGSDDTVVLRSTDQTVDGHWRLEEPARRKLSSGEKASALLREGDLLLTKSSGSALHIGKTTLVTPEIEHTGCCFSNFMQRIRTTHDISSRLAWFVLNNELTRSQFDLLSNSTTGLANLNGALIGSIIVPVPPPIEQAAIVSFLDRETAKIDGLVEEQKRLIDLLEEKRQAVISYAVTEGLDPNAPMKDSGIEWLGKIPEHWEVRPISSIFSMGRGRVISHEYIAENEGPFPVYSSQTEDDGEMGRIATYDFEGNYITWTTDGAHAGTVFRRSGRFNCTNVCGTLKPRGEVDLDYMSLIIGKATGYFVRHDINPKLMNGVMGKIRIPLPKIEEQREITAFIHERTGHFSKLVSAAEEGIILFQERRSALISAAVTGKIDVRDRVPQQVAAE